MYRWISINSTHEARSCFTIMNRLSTEPRIPGSYAEEFAHDSLDGLDRGSIRFGVLAKVAALATVSSVAFGLANVNNVRHAELLGEETTATAEGGAGEVTDVFAIPPKTCFGGVETEVEAVRAKLAITRQALGVNLPTAGVDWWSQDLYGQIDSEVCVSDVEDVDVRSRTLNRETNHVTIRLTEEALTMTHSVDQVRQRYVSDHGPASTWEALFDETVKSVSNANLGAVDSRESLLRGLANLRAFELVSGECGPAAWDLLKPILEEAIIQDELNEAARQGVERTRDQVTVELPETVSYLDHQYSEDVADIANQIKENGLNGAVDFPSVQSGQNQAATSTAETITCEPAPDLAYFNADPAQLEASAEGEQ